MNQKFAERFNAKHGRRPSVIFMISESKERADEFFDEMFITDGPETPGAAEGVFSDIVTRGDVGLRDNETPRVMLQIMRGEYPFTYQQHQGLLIDPTKFEVCEALEHMHFWHAQGERGYTSGFVTFAGKDEDMAEILKYNVRCCVQMFEYP